VSADGTVNIRTNAPGGIIAPINEITIGVFNGFDYGIVTTVTEIDTSLKLGTACDVNGDGSTFVVAGEGFGISGNLVGFRVYDFDGTTATQRGGDVITDGVGDLLSVGSKNNVKIADDGNLVAISAIEISGPSVLIYIWDGSTWLFRETIDFQTFNQSFGGVTTDFSMSDDGRVIVLGSGTTNDAGEVQVINILESKFFLPATNPVVIIENTYTVTDQADPDSTLIQSVNGGTVQIKNVYADGNAVYSLIDNVEGNSNITITDSFAKGGFIKTDNNENFSSVIGGDGTSTELLETELPASWDPNIWGLGSGGADNRPLLIPFTNEEIFRGSYTGFRSQTVVEREEFPSFDENGRSFLKALFVSLSNDN
jgi:hypothetical protein